MILITILNQLLSFFNVSSNVVEVVFVKWIRQDLIPWSSLDSLLWEFGRVKNLNRVWVIRLDVIVPHEVVVLEDELVGIRELDGLEEVWQVFVNVDFSVSHCETPCSQLRSSKLLNDVESNSVETESEGWRAVVNGPGKEMIRFHLFSNVSNVRPLIVENLSVSKHPISVNEEQKWGESESLDAVDSESVIQSRWLLHHPGNDDSLDTVLVEVVQSSNWEKQRHAKSVKHCDIGNVQHSGVLEMDNVVCSTVQGLVQSH